MTNPNNHDKLCGCNDSDHREMFALVDKFHRPTNKDELRKQYPISTFTGATQDELIEFVLGYANQRVEAEKTAFIAGCVMHGMPDEDVEIYTKAFDKWKATLKESKDEPTHF